MRFKKTLLLIALLAGAGASRRDRASAEPTPRTIDVTAKRFEFKPDKLVLKKGETVKLRVKSEDVIHGFFNRPLKIDEELSPGELREISLTPAEAGSYTVICDHFCGSQHGNMKMTVVVEP